MKILNQLLIAAFLMSAWACEHPKKEKITKDDRPLSLIASSSRQWTGITISPEGRMFVNFPRWSDDVPLSVAEIIDGKVVPFPNEAWNTFNGKNEAEHFTAVQSVVVDDRNFLWVLDPANPQFQGVLEGGPRLHLFNLDRDEFVKTIPFSRTTWSQNSYFNDLRIDTETGMIYITDSGAGGLIILNLNTGVSRKVLADHPSTQAETDYLVFENGLWKNQVHSDGIALSPDKKYLYYAALTAHSLYRIPTAALQNPTFNDEDLAHRVERVASIAAPDGMLFDNTGNLFMADLENEAVAVYNEERYFQFLKDPKIRWADTFAKDPEGNIYFTTSQINYAVSDRKDYEIYRINIQPKLPVNKGKILIALTSHAEMGQGGEPTGYFLSEVSHAYYTFLENGYEVAFVSPNGGEAPLTGMDTTDMQNRNFLKDDTAQKLVRNSIKASDINPKDYRAIYYAGGHGTMWDFPTDENLATISQVIYEDGGVVGAVCHGPSGLLPIKLSNGEYLIKGKKVNGFSNEEETAMKLEKTVPLLLEDALIERGGIFSKGPMWGDYSVADQRVVSGQNPASAHSVAQKMVDWLAK
ncbi:L-dopachrome tautomerase-related protein [Persicobacter diffluens]